MDTFLNKRSGMLGVSGISSDNQEICRQASEGNERCVLVTGDGSFGMNLNELATAVSYNLPVTIVLFNNGVLGMVRQWQTLFYNKHYSNTVLDRKTDFSALAKAFGADGQKVKSVEELDLALKKAFEGEKYLCLIGKYQLMQE